MEQAYKLAKKAGYQGRLYAPTMRVEFLDPLFWQSLGKALGWKGTGIFKSCLCLDKEFHTCELMNWHLEWHRFIDLLIEGKDAESYFKELLK